MAKSKQIRLGADRDLLQAMKTTQEAGVARAKVFNDKLQALRAGVGPALHFFQEDGDENRTMAELVERITDRANAYAQSLAKDGITRTLSIVQLTVPRVELVPLREFQASDYSLEVLTDAEKAVEDLGERLMKQFWQRSE